MYPNYTLCDHMATFTTKVVVHADVSLYEGYVNFGSFWPITAHRDPQLFVDLFLFKSKSGLISHSQPEKGQSIIDHNQLKIRTS